MNTLAHLAYKPAAAVLAVILSTGTIAAAAGAAEKTGNGSVEITEYSNWGDPDMAKIAVDSGRALMQHLASAGALLASGKIAQARSALITSREFADAIQRTMPYLTVVDDLRDAGKHVVQEDLSVWSADLLPIYAGLDELRLYAPKVASHTRGMVRKAEKDAAAGDKGNAARELTEAADEIAQHTVYIPVNYVDEQVRGALYALDRVKPDVTGAKKAVGRALDSVTLVVNEVVATPG
jgi:hypothetical protein